MKIEKQMINFSKNSISKQYHQTAGNKYFMNFSNPIYFLLIFELNIDISIKI
jgi:hypothetical protein